MKISLVTGSSSAMASRPVLLDAALERRKAVIPEHIDEGAQIAERLVVHAVEAFRPVAPQLQQAHAGEQPQVLGNGLPRGPEVRGNLAGGKLGAVHQSQDRDALRFGQSLEQLVHLLRTAMTRSD